MRRSDFGEALAVIGGAERKIHFFAMDLPHSDGCLVQAYPAESSEAFCEGHRIGFEFFGGVPRSILYDNLKLAVARILGDGRRLKDPGFQRAAVALSVRRPLRTTRARATTRARSKGWWAMRGATSWCLFHTQPASPSSTRGCWSAAAGG